MRRIKHYRPSPATVLASIALFVSLGGVSYGVATGSIDSREIKNNTVRSKDIRNNQVASRDIRNNSVRGRDVRNSSLTGSDVKNDSLRGSDILETSLGLVPSANTANFAVRANTAGAVDKLKTVGSYKKVTASTSGPDQDTARANATEVPLFSFGQFDVYGKCYVDNSGPDTVAETFIRTHQDGSILSSDDSTLDGSTFLDTGTAESSRDMSEADGFTDDADTDSDDNATFSAQAPDGTAISGQAEAAARNGTLAGGNGIYGDGNVCIFSGYAIS
jgi:hypothetical protein